METARSDQREIGKQSAHLRLLLNTADQIADRRVVFHDDGGGRFRSVADQQIDAEAAQARIAFRGDVGERHAGNHLFALSYR